MLEQKFNLITLGVKDLQRSIDFYEMDENGLLKI